MVNIVYIKPELMLIFYMRFKTVCQSIKHCSFLTADEAKVF